MTKVCEYPSVEKSILKILTLQFYRTDHFVKVEKIIYIYSIPQLETMIPGRPNKESYNLCTYFF